MEKKQFGVETLNFLRAFLSAVSALFLAIGIPAVWTLDLRPDKATGLAVLAFGLLEATISSPFWVLFLLCFLWLHIASRSSKRVVRILLFWIPAVLVSAVGFAFLITFRLLIARLPPPPVH